MRYLASTSHTLFILQLISLITILIGLFVVPILFIFYFFLWTFILYWIHRATHANSALSYFHLDHHSYILKNQTAWHYSNIFLYNDNLKSTIDLWLTEVIPTIIFSIVTEQFWIFIFYYIWAAFIQENIEHNEQFNIPLLTSGRWHLIHHRSKHNYGLFFPIWDIVFKTYKKVT